MNRYEVKAVIWLLIAWQALLMNKWKAMQFTDNVSQCHVEY